MSQINTNAIYDANGGQSAVLYGVASPPNGLLFRNRIINGDMRIDQRNAGASVNNSAGLVYSVDRFYVYGAQASKLSFQQNAGSITPPAGFTHYLGLTSLAATSLVSTDTYSVGQVIEGFNIADLGWGTANAKAITLSFQVYSSLTGTFGGALNNNGSSRSYPFTYSIPVANTWTTISVQIAGDTTGTWLTNNGIGLRVQFGLGVGSTFSGTAGAWTSANYNSATGATSVVGTNGATFYITGVQLEAGSVATPFERVEYGEMLRRCQRYFQVLRSSGVLAGRAGSTSIISVGIPLSVPLRGTPTMSNGGTAYAYSGSTRIDAVGSTFTADTVGQYDVNMSAARAGFTGLTDDRIYNMLFASSVTLSAEL